MRQGFGQNLQVRSWSGCPWCSGVPSPNDSTRRRHRAVRCSHHRHGRSALVLKLAEREEHRHVATNVPAQLDLHRPWELLPRLSVRVFLQRKAQVAHIDAVAVLDHYACPECASAPAGSRGSAAAWTDPSCSPLTSPLETLSTEERQQQPSLRSIAPADVRDACRARSGSAPGSAPGSQRGFPHHRHSGGSARNHSGSACCLSVRRANRTRTKRGSVAAAAAPPRPRDACACSEPTPGQQGHSSP